MNGFSFSTFARGIRRGMGDRAIWLPVGLFFLLFVIYRVSPISQIYDSKYSMLVSESIYRNGTLDLSTYQLDQPASASTQPATLPYQMQFRGNRLYYFYPTGTSILSIPAVAALNFLGPRALTSEGRYDSTGDRHIQRMIAAALCALAGCLFYRTSRLFLPVSYALAVALVSALGSPVWSTASRGMWSHTWGIVLLAWAIDHVARWAMGRGSLRPVVLGTSLAWMFFVRPTFALAAVMLGAWLLLRAPRKALSVGAVTAAWLAAFSGASFFTYGRMLPPYYGMAQGLSTATFLEAALGHLVSPSRGLLIYCPWIVSTLLLLGCFWRRVQLKGLALTALAAVGTHWLFFSFWPMWWMGHCYGPRAMTDVIPWWNLLAAMALAAMFQKDASLGPVNGASMLPGKNRILRTAATVLAVAAIALNGVGALSRGASAWNVLPRNIDADPARAWDWNDPQFIAGFRSESPGK